ncbi:MAG: hypothetical protein H6534_06500, partial [Chthonomonadaceae bacterium]|nr:hypothetical protein [Chthonomonadaceae bacterium]
LTKTDSFTYWPYGETRTSSGSTPTKYKFVGTLGCREQADGGIYMRARVEDPEDGRWMTVDPLWPGEPPFAYVSSSPISRLDPSGLRQEQADIVDCGTKRDITTRQNVPIPFACPLFRSVTGLREEQLPCESYGGFPGGLFPPDTWACLLTGIHDNCADSRFDPINLAYSLRCIAWAENSDSMGGRTPPWGMFQIGRRGSKCDKLYPDWKTSACGNAKCAALLLCDCLRRGKGLISGCGRTGFVHGGPPDYLLFDVLFHPKNHKFCDCMIGCGYHW